MYKLKWHGVIPENVLEIEQIVLQDLATLHNDLDQQPSKLTFHNVAITDQGYEGPIVFVWGEKEDNEHYHCKYDKDPTWISYKEHETPPKYTATVVEDDNGELVLEFDPAVVETLGWNIGDTLQWIIDENDRVWIKKADDGT